jgi:hypothetical protein
MTVSLTITDGSLSGQIVQKFQIEIPTTTTTARQLIEQRIAHEVARYNQSAHEHAFNGLVTPTEAETQLNDGDGVKQTRWIDPAAQSAKALLAFERNGFFLLVDEQQVSALDTPLHVSEISTIQFVKLVPLIGG